MSDIGTTETASLLGNRACAISSIGQFDTTDNKMIRLSTDDMSNESRDCGSWDSAQQEWTVGIAE